MLALGLGIGANTAIFSLINAFLLRPMPYRDSERLVWVQQNILKSGAAGAVAYPDFVEWKRQNHVFAELAAIQFDQFNVTGPEEAERILGARVSAGFFPLLGVSPTRGRAFLPEEDSPGGNRVVILSQGLWQRRFGSQPDILGQALTLNGTSYTIVGIMPADFRFPPTCELWTPLALDVNRAGWGNHFLAAIAGLKPGVGLGKAQAEMATIARRLEQQYPDSNAGWGVTVVPLHEFLVRESRPALFTLLVAVVFVLLIACANVANLLLARAAARTKEIAIRLALGAGRFRIIRQMLTESVLVSMLGGAVGLLLALWGTRLLATAMPFYLLSLQTVRIDGYVLAFTLLISVLTGLIFGLAPALQVSKGALNETLKEGGRRSAPGGSRGRLRGILVVSEVALALMLLVGAGLLMKSFARLQQVNPGFRSEKVLTMEMSLPPARYSKPFQRAAFYRQLLEKIATLPGVQSAGAVTQLPLGGRSSTRAFAIEGRPAPPPGQGERIGAGHRVVTPGYFRAMSIPLRRGRQFTDQDAEGAPGVVLINETMARRWWPNEDPLGKRIALYTSPQTVGPWLQIVGIVGDVKHRGLAAEIDPEMYLPHMQTFSAAMFVAVRTVADPASMAAAVRAQVRALDRDLPVSSIRTMEKVLADAVAQPRLRVWLLGGFAALALILAVMGLYGVISYSVTQRTHELGVRMALGAQTPDLLRLVVAQGMLVTLIGLGIGLAGAFALTRLLASLLFSVSATDAAIFTAVPLLLALVALAATAIPARRAARLDPMTALRYE